VEIFDDLEAEFDRIETILERLDADAWRSPSAAEGWTVTDVVLHLAQSEEAVIATTGAPLASAVDRTALRARWGSATETLDDAMDALVAAERDEPRKVFDRWRAARRASLAALRVADPDHKFDWAAAPLKPATLATTRLAEHWAHTLDIVEPLAIDYPDTDRLRHIAWLGHSSLPYAFTFNGLEPHAVYCELRAPGGDTWHLGPPDADSTITGAGGVFCRVGAHRLRPDDSGLVTTGPHGRAALGVLRNYAG
jgi:uncharacterized protein (TIGR03084 family)